MSINTEVTLSNENGFTLIEVLIAISILSILMVGIFTFTDGTFTTAERVIREDKELLQIETGMSRLEWDFSQIYSPLYFSHVMNPEKMTEEEGEIYNQLLDSYQQNNRFSLLNYDGLPIPLYQNPDKSTLAFFTSSNRRKFENSKQSNFGWVKYSLMDNDVKIDSNTELKTTKAEKKSQMLVRHFLNHNIYDPSKIEWDDLKTQVLLRKVISLLFEFWNPESQKWTDNLELIKNGYNIIYALRVTIKYYDSDNLEKVSVRIFRPLYPEFTPEDMYKFLEVKTKSNGEEADNESESSGSGSSGGGNQ